LEVLGNSDRIHALIHPLTWMFGDLDMAATYNKMSSELENEIHRSFEDFIVSTNRYLLERTQRDASRADLYRRESLDRQ